MKPTTHPLALAADRRLDILYGGTAEEATIETLLIARHALTALKPEHTVLYINTAMAFDIVESKLNKLPLYQRERIKQLGAAGDTFPTRLEFVRHLMSIRNVGLVILNVFDFAALNPRHRALVFNLLRWMQNKKGANVIVVTINAPNNVGTMAGFRYSAQTISKIGDWLVEEEPLTIQPAQDAALNDKVVDGDFTYRPYGVARDPGEIADALRSLDDNGPIDIATLAPAEERIPQDVPEFELSEETSRRVVPQAAVGVASMGERSQGEAAPVTIDDRIDSLLKRALKNKDLTRPNVTHTLGTQVILPPDRSSAQQPRVHS